VVQLRRNSSAINTDVCLSPLDTQCQLLQSTAHDGLLENHENYAKMMTLRMLLDLEPIQRTEASRTARNEDDDWSQTYDKETVKRRDTAKDR
jgi:hypothetical protein